MSHLYFCWLGRIKIPETTKHKYTANFLYTFIQGHAFIELLLPRNYIKIQIISLYKLSMGLSKNQVER